VLGITLSQALKMSTPLRKMAEDNPKVKELLDMAMALEGTPRHASTHAAAVVITRDPVYQYMPLSRNDEAIVTQYPKDTVEELGLLKMDFLGLRNLTIIDDAIKMIRMREPRFSLDHIPDDDRATFQMLSEGKTSGVFQLESAGMTGVCLSLGPRSIEDITAVVALYRPGPMDSIPRFIASSKERSKVTYHHPALQPILEVTYGCIVYQEQVLDIFRTLAGYSLGQADMMRRAIAKKHQDEITRERDAFINGDPERGIAGCIKNGIPAEVADKIYEEILDFASYAFNKAHAVAYAILAYQTAYLKCHYPREYMAALLSSVLDSTAKVSAYIGECNQIGIRVLPPDINRSFEGFRTEGDNIRFGLVAVRNVGQKLISQVVAQRQLGGDFKSLRDFLERMQSGSELNKRAAESLISCGAFDSFGVKRSQLLQLCASIMGDLSRQKRSNIAGQMDLFGMAGEEFRDEYPDIPEFSLKELLAMEKETTGLYLSGHPLDEYRQVIRRLGCPSIGSVLEEDPAGRQFEDGQRLTLAGTVASVKKKTTKTNAMMAYVNLEDDSGTLEVIVFPSALERWGDVLTADEAVLLKGRLSLRDDREPQLICDEALRLSNAEREQPAAPAASRLFVRLPSFEGHDYVKLKAILTMFPGNMPMVLCSLDSDRREKTGCQNHPLLLRELERLYGKDNVKLV